MVQLKVSSWILVVACLTITPPVGAASDGGEVELVTLSVTGQILSAKPKPVYFAGQTAEFAFARRQGSGCHTYSAVLVQVSDRLEVERSRDDLEVCRPGPEESGEQAGSGILQFAVPDVARKSDFEWRFFACDAQQANCLGVTQIGFTVYPADLLDPLRTWADENMLVVRDRDLALQDFLDSQRIAYSDRPVGRQPGIKTVTLIADREGALRPKAIGDALARGGVVVFREEPETLPLVKTILGRGQVLTIVQMALIDSLNTSPAAQEAFLTIFRDTQRLEASQ